MECVRWFASPRLLLLLLLLLVVVVVVVVVVVGRAVARAAGAAARAAVECGGGEDGGEGGSEPQASEGDGMGWRAHTPSRGGHTRGASTAPNKDAALARGCPLRRRHPGPGLPCRPRAAGTHSGG